MDTDSVEKFAEATKKLEFESYNGGRDSKERLAQGLLTALNQVAFSRQAAAKNYSLDCKGVIVSVLHQNRGGIWKSTPDRDGSGNRSLWAGKD